MQAKKWIPPVVVLVALAAVAFYAARRATIYAHANETIVSKPYVLQRAGYKITNGTKTAAMLETHAHMTNGVHVRMIVTQNAKGQPETIRRVDDPNRGRVGMFLDSLKTKSTGYIPTEMLARQKTAMQSPPLNCLLGLNEILDGEETMGGQQALRIVAEASTGFERTIYWRAPAFGCTTLQGLHQERKQLTDDWTTTDGVDLVSFVPGEPDHRVLVDETQYSETKPSDVAARGLAAAGVNAATCKTCMQNLAADDATYQRWQKPVYKP